jgi:hypothetical protein
MKAAVQTVAALLLLLDVTSCAPYWSIAPKRVAVQDDIIVEPGESWARAWVTPFDGWAFWFPAPVERWTIDGERLDLLTFYVGVPDGQPLIRIPDVKEKSLPPFRQSMSPPEILDLFEAAIAKADSTAVVEGRNLRPAKFGDADGFRFEMSLTPPDDIDRELAAVGAVHDGKLYLVTFEGTRLYHFARHLPEFERIIATVRFAEK